MNIKNTKYFTRTFIVLLMILPVALKAQRPIRGLPGGLGRLGSQSFGQRSAGTTKDSLVHRTGLEDSVTISFRHLDTSRFAKFDSTIGDYYKRFPLPWDYIYLGNIGNAARSLIFSPLMQPGWDPGFHAYDAYRFTVDGTKFFTTTRPYAELGYTLGGKGEQQINVVHTQNIKYNWNFAMQYRLINSPGFFQNGNTNHNNYRFNSWYQSNNRKFYSYFIIQANSLNSSENGGIANDSLLDDLAVYKDRFNIPTKLGVTGGIHANYLTNKIDIGNSYRDFTFLTRNSYDVGRKDSIQTDSLTYYIFHPKLRFQHTLQYNTYKYLYKGTNANEDYYKTYYNADTVYPDFNYTDKWKELVNDFSIYQFPYEKNLQQFFTAGISLQNLKGIFDSATTTRYNAFVHGEYRNQTRNKKWDIELKGSFFLAGFNSGNYGAFAKLKREISKNAGYLELGFENVNKSPAYIHNDQSSFKIFDTVPRHFSNTNITSLHAEYDLPQKRLKLRGRYFLLSNYIYFKNYYEADQDASLFNLLQLGLEKEFSLGKYFHWFNEAVFQQTDGTSPVNVPALTLHSRFAFEGNFYQNLDLSIGLEMRYYTPYYADAYSPVPGQFFLQQEKRIANRPDIAGYLHFRIRSFWLYLRAENLNTIRFSPEFGFTNNNMVAPHYPTPGFMTRLGIFWSFVN